MNQQQINNFENALVRYREKWAKIKDPEVNYNFAVPETSLKEMFLALLKKQPQKDYVLQNEKSYTYKECNDLALHIANGFLEQGLIKGDRVIVYVSNSFEFIAIAHACFKTGIIMVNSNPRSTADEISQRIKNCTPRVIISDCVSCAAVLKAMEKNRGGVEKLFFCPAHGQSCVEDQMLRPWEELLSDSLEEPDVLIRGEDIAVLQYTGGTTGVIKGCCQTNHALAAKALAMREFFKPVLSPEDFENYLVVVGLGMSHTFGFSHAILSHLTIGGTVYLAESLEEILYAIEKFKPTVWPAVPFWIKKIAAEEKYQKYDMSSLKAITCGSSPLPVEVMRKMERITGALVSEGYGMTEAVSTVTMNSFAHRKPGTVGVVHPNAEYLIVDAETGTQVVPDGETGEIICRGACVMKEYWNNPEETALTVRDGWLYSGDIGCIDEDGYLVIKDRKKDMIISSGFNVYPSEIETVLMSLKGVADAAVVGVPDAVRGEVSIAFVKLAGSSEIDSMDIRNHCEKRLSKYKLPREYYIVDTIPKTKNNKPDKEMLKKMLGMIDK